MYDSDMGTKTTGDRLKEQRERAGLSMGQVEEYEGITRQYLWKLEKGENAPPTWPLLAALARRYQCSVDYLLGVVDEPMAHNGTLLSGAIIAMVERIAELPGYTQAMMMEILDAVTRQEAAEREDRRRQWNDLMELTLKSVAGSVGTEGGSGGGGLSTPELLRLLDTPQENDG
jgi:transcriptional regulator with XRE-family HTH domain